jgi:hypothetical protein
MQNNTAEIQIKFRLRDCDISQKRQNNRKLNARGVLRPTENKSLLQINGFSQISLSRDCDYARAQCIFSLGKTYLNVFDVDGTVLVA